LIRPVLKSVSVDLIILQTPPVNLGIYNPLPTLPIIETEGPKGEGSCYWIRNVFIQFYDDKLTEVAILSPSYSADKIDTMVKNWGTFALKGLTDKYGNPTSVYNSIESVNILTFKPGYDITLYE